ncbi:hypothetical protein LCGC14_1984010, partial [marine sediment metagenome]
MARILEGTNQPEHYSIAGVEGAAYVLT